MSAHHHHQEVPRAALLGALFLILVTIGVAAHARSERLSQPVSTFAVETYEVRFEDRPDGALAVLDAKTNHDVTVLAPRSNNFVRGVLRGMFRSRKLESKGHDDAFLLSRESDGHLILLDPQTDRHVQLDSFGPTNTAAFEDILVAARAAR
jgi:putative photosynthetic complex assembly protein